MFKRVLFLLVIFALAFSFCGKKSEKKSTEETAKKEELNLPKGREIAVIETKFGKIYLDFLENDAPKHVENFKKLAKEGFFNGTTFHRVVPNFVIQGGDPLSKDDDRANDGTGGPGYTIPAEIKAKHLKGYVGAARMPDNVNPQKESNGSQFYICLRDLPMLDGNYTVFAKVIAGMDVVEKIAQQKTDERDNPIEKIEMKVYLIKK